MRRAERSGVERRQLRELRELVWRRGLRAETGWLDPCAVLYAQGVLGFGSWATLSVIQFCCGRVLVLYWRLE